MIFAAAAVFLVALVGVQFLRSSPSEEDKLADTLAQVSASHLRD